MEVHRRSNLVSTFLIIAIAIATLAIGFIGGEYINTQHQTKMQQQEILDEFKSTQNKTVEPSGSEAQADQTANEKKAENASESAEEAKDEAKNEATSGTEDAADTQPDTNEATSGTEDAADIQPDTNEANAGGQN